MIIDKPRESQIPLLRKLWKEAFEDTDAFLDKFFSTAFSYERCRCVTENGQTVSALYWFDCELEDKKIAYFYAIATANAHRGKGYCRALIESTHAHLAESGYAAAMLSPASEALFKFYGKLGYKNCTNINEFTCDSASEGVYIELINGKSYEELRRKYLPRGGVIQEKESTAFLQTFSQFYKGENFILCARKENGSLFGAELLGNIEVAPKILCSLGYKGGTFRTVGKSKPFTMLFPIKDLTPPDYFGHAFD